MQALAEISALDVVDSILEEMIQDWSDRLDEHKSRHSWLFLDRVSFPCPSLMRKHLSDHQVIKETWTSLFPQGSALFRRYLDDLAIETNHIEGIFLLTAAVCVTFRS